jgi:flagellar basal body-associated protein FliL
MKKLISIVVALALSQAALIRPMYAVENETTTEITTVSSEVVATEAITLPQAVILVPDYGTTADETDSDGEPLENAEGIFQAPGGAGTLLEDVSDDDVSRQFITVRSRGGNIFYIIIDNDSNSENVYFLSAVNDWDLISFSENFPDGVWEAYEEIKEEAAANAIAAEIAANAGEEPNEKTSETPETPTGGGSTSTIILVVVGLGFAGGFAYFKFFKGKKKQATMPNYDQDEDEDDSENEQEED